MRINPILYGVLVLTLFLGIILGFQSAGIWSISGKVTASGEQVQPDAADVNTIKGWMTLDQISATFNVSVQDLITQFNLPAGTLSTTALKDLESDTFDTTSLRDWLQSQIDPAALPTSENAPADLPTPALSPTPSLPDQSPPAPTEHAAPANTVTGKTTFQDLLDWGVSKDAIQKIIGGEIPAPSVVIKDYVTGKGLEFTSIKTQLQAEVDKLI
jgi:hypothetical protein